MRQWSILRYLGSSPIGRHIDQIAKEVECNTRTIRRDLEALRRAGFAIYPEKHGQSTLWKSSEGFRAVPPIPVTLPESVALLLVQAQLKGNPDEFTRTAMTSLTDKILKSRPREFREQMELLQEKFYSQPEIKSKSKPAQDNIVETLMTAITTSVKVSATYQNAQGRSSSNRKLAPLHIWLVNNSKYLISYCYKRKQVLTFHLNRFKTVEVLPEPYKVEWDFNMEKYAEDAFGAFHSRAENISMLFDPLLKNYLRENPLHRSQKLTAGDSGVTLTMKAGINESLVSKIMSFGSLVRVIAPERLAILVMERHRSAYETYKSELPSDTPGLPLVF